MAARRYDLPFSEDGSGRFLPWMIALMVYLAALASVAALAAREVVEQWNAGLEGSATVEIAPSPDDATTEERVAQVLEIVRAARGVESAEAVPAGDINRLLAPWLGTEIGGLPLPRLVDVKFRSGQAVDLRALSGALTRVSGARLDDHSLWRERLRTLGRTVQVAAIIIVELIAIAAGATVVFATRSGLAVHRELIELMHLIGSRDSYIARQFQNHAMSLALRGGLLGIALAAVTLGVIAIISRPIGDALVPGVSIGAATLAALAALPLIAAGIATLTARVTVLRTLRQMP